MAEKLRIFISSPSDVTDERRRAALVIRRLNREFARFFDLEALLWEREPMRASGHFQDIIMPPSATDIVVVILCARLGTPLPERTAVRQYCGLDGRSPVTGTEWEFEDALRRNRECGVPELLVYRKPAAAAAVTIQADRLDEAKAQLLALEAFWRRHFVDERGGFKAAFNQFETLDAFEEQLEQHLRQLLRARLPGPEAGSKPADTEIAWHQGSPFRGLQVFEAAHEKIFFGRARAEQAVIEALVRQASIGTAFVLVLGASGSGKSSLVRAGVVPQLMAPGVVTGVEVWRSCVFKPSEATGDLVAALARALIGQSDALSDLPAAGIDLSDVISQLRAAAVLPLKMGLRQSALAMPRPAGAPLPEARLVLVIDQLEELFTLGEITTEQQANFVSLLAALAKSGVVWVLATMRSDLYHRCAELPELIDLAAGEGQYHLTTPRPAELDQMIRLPAAAAGIGFEIHPDTRIALNAVLLEAAARDPTALPLLEFILNELYHQDIEAHGPLLTYESYTALDGLEGAIAARADTVCRGLPPAPAAELPSLLSALVTVGEDSDLATARVVPRADLATTPARTALLDILVSERLLVADDDRMGPVIRLTHEALLSNWPLLKDLVDRDRDFLRVRTRLQADQARWQAEGCNQDLLLPAGKRLEEAKEVLKARRDEIDAATTTFIEGSIERDRQLRQRGLRRTRAVAAVMAALAAIAGGVGWYSYNRSVEAEQQRVHAQEQEAEAKRQRDQTLQTQSLFLANLSNQQIHNGDKVVGLLLALEALPDSDSPTQSQRERPYVVEAEASLYQALDDLTNPVSTINISSDIATSYSSSIAIDASFRPDGKVVVLTDHSDGKTRVATWDVESGQLIKTIKEYEYSGNGKFRDNASFSPNGTHLVTSSDEGAEVWDADSGKLLLSLKGKVAHASFSPDGTRILGIAGTYNERQHWEGYASIWDTDSGSHKLDIKLPKEGITTAAFSPDGTRVLTGFTRTVESEKLWEGGLDIWDANTGGHIFRINYPEGEITTASFSQDGTRIISGSSDGRAAIWGAYSGLLLRTLGDKQGTVTDKYGLRTGTYGLRNSVDSASFSPNGQHIITAHSDTMIRHWDAQTGMLLAVVNGHTDSVNSAAFNKDGNRIVTASSDGTVKIWYAFRSTRDLITHIKTVVPRCLSNEERRTFFLTPQMPKWCSEMAKWPSDGASPEQESMLSLAHDVGGMNFSEVPLVGHEFSQECLNTPIFGQMLHLQSFIVDMLDETYSRRPQIYEKVAAISRDRGSVVKMFKFAKEMLSESYTVAYHEQGVDKLVEFLINYHQRFQDLSKEQKSSLAGDKRVAEYELLLRLPKPEHKCLEESAGGTYESLHHWFLSFWNRRYLEGNADVVLRILKWLRTREERPRPQDWAEIREESARRGPEKPLAVSPVPVPVPTGRALKALETFRDCAECPEMVVIPAGSFMMGSPANEPEGDSYEVPQYRVTIGPFGIGKTEVTFAQWDACVTAGGCNAYKPFDQGWGRGSRPVVNVSWKDAKAYVSWLSQHIGKPYRLPSEAEWEYAARAGATTGYAVGDAITPKDANYDGNVGKTTEVGAYPPNAGGLYDMHGNVWEWVEDVWHDSYKGAPSDGSAWTDGEGENSSRYRVYRGGSWGSVPGYLRSASRVRDQPEGRDFDLGLRVARTLD